MNGNTDPILNLVPETLVLQASTILQQRSNDLSLRRIVGEAKTALSQHSLQDLLFQIETLQCLLMPIYHCTKDNNREG